MTPLYKHTRQLSDYQVAQIIHIYKHNSRQLGFVYFFDNIVARNVEFFFWAFFGSSFIFYFLWQSWLCFLPMVMGLIFFIVVILDAIIYEISLARITKICRNYVDNSLCKESIRIIIRSYYDKTTRTKSK